MSHQAAYHSGERGGRGGFRHDGGRGGRGRGGGRGGRGGRGGGRGGGPPRDPVQLWDSSVKWFFDEDGGSKPPPGEDMKGMNKKRAREYHVSGRERSRAPAPEAAAAKASLELRRFKLVKRLRHQLALRCGALSITPPLLAFERWLCRAMLQGGDAVPVPMLPAVDAGGGLGRDLHRAGAPDLAAADAAAAELATASGALAAKLADPDPDESAADAAAKVTVDDAGPLLALKVNDAKPYMTISKAHMGKLRAVYCRHSLGGAPLPPEGTEEHAAFVASAFAMLARYESLGGAGYQAALGERAFDVLKTRLGVGCEAFASPLNCRYGRFCSAFPDVDAPFGSLGSFFDFKPTRGSFEMNPPFVPETLLAAAKHAEGLLDDAEAAGGRLSFVVVVPAWKDVPMWEALDGSKHKRGEVMIVPAAEHGFCDGAQHCRPPAERHRVSSYDTGVFFLQTTAGARRWPVTEEIRSELRDGMKAAVGTAKTVGDLEKRYRGEKKPGTEPRGRGEGERDRSDGGGRRDEYPRTRREERDDEGAGEGDGEKKRRRRRRKREDEC